MKNESLLKSTVRQAESIFRYEDVEFLLDIWGLWKKKKPKFDKDGVQIIVVDPKDAKDYKISDPIMVTARLCNHETQYPFAIPSPDLHLLISFMTQEKEIKEIHFAKRVIGQSSSLINDLIGHGFYVDLTHKRQLINFLNKLNPQEKLFYVAKPGWTSRLDAFVFPTKTISWDRKTTDTLKLLNYNKKFDASGSFKKWQKHVVKPCVEYPLFAFALATAFTPPLLRLVNMDSFCVNLYGESSKGKTTALQVAASVWGCGSEPSKADSYVYNWNATGNALNYLAAGSNDVLLAMDELGSFRNESLGQVVYALSGGKSRKGMKADNKARDDLTWNMLLLSTSEVSGRQRMEEDGRVYTGQLNRFIDIPVNQLKTKCDANLVDALKKSCSEYYGWAGLQLIKSITQHSDDKDDLIRKIAERHEENYQYLLKEAESLLTNSDELTSELKRSIKRFALIFTAAKLIARGNILDLYEANPAVNDQNFDKDDQDYQDYVTAFTQADSDVRETLLEVFRVWLKNINQEPRSISDRIVASIRNYLMANQAKFIKTTGNKKLPALIVGYYHKRKKLFLLTDDTFAKACHGFSVNESAKVLDSASVKLLHKHGDEQRFKACFSVQSINGQKKTRLYAIEAKILSED